MQMQLKKMTPLDLNNGKDLMTLLKMHHLKEKDSIDGDGLQPYPHIYTLSHMGALQSGDRNFQMRRRSRCHTLPTSLFIMLMNIFKLQSSHPLGQLFSRFLDKIIHHIIKQSKHHTSYP